MAKQTTFRQGDLTKAAKGLIAAGLSVAHVVVEPNGKFILTTDNGEKTEDDSAYDAWKRKRNANSA